ncbi:MAG: hypothetical protein JOY79_06405 [Acidobacteriaceae bacterium]|nr:hypothetical protein [Acidobacteriaceae bacterium]
MCTTSRGFRELGEPSRGDLWLYRDRTMAVLRKYFQLAIDIGRLPSMLGTEFFRTQVTSYKRGSFEDRVIFVHDVERCFEALDKFSQMVIAHIVLQNYNQRETANILHCARRTVMRRFPDALDELTSRFLDCGILASLPASETLSRGESLHDSTQPSRAQELAK